MNETINCLTGTIEELLKDMCDYLMFKINEARNEKTKEE